MRIRSVGLLSAVTLACLLGACAEGEDEDADDGGLNTETVRAFLIEGLEANKQMDIGFARAIPDTAMRWAPNDEVRDFAEQVMHTADNSWAAGGLGVAPHAFGDTATVLNDKEALVTAVTAAYDWAINAARTLSAEDLAAEADFFGTPTERWRMFMQMIEHATWTRGQLVPYFHHHGVAVPSVTFY
jgi:hypothetical protein